MKTPRRRARQAEYLGTLIHSLTLDQIRTAVASLASGPPPAVKTKDSALGALEATGRSLDQIEQALLAVESHQPSQHLFLARFDPLAMVMDSLQFRAQATLTTDTLSFDLVFHERTRTFTTMTYEHYVLAREWKPDPDKPIARIPVESHLRHPLVFRFYPFTRLMLMAYPGFSQGGAITREERVSYHDIVSGILQAMSQEYGLGITSVPVKQCLVALDEADATRVRIVDGDLAKGDGHLSLGSGSDASMRDFLAGIIGEYLSPDVQTKLVRAIGEAFGSMTANSLVSFWVRERVTTRVQFWDEGTEFRFVWRGLARSYYVVENIVKLVTDVAAQYDSLDSRALWEYVLSLADGATVTPWQIASERSVNADEVKRALVDAMNVGLTKLVFRMRAPLLEETQNAWTEDLTTLLREFHTVDGAVLDGRDPKNVEVGFRRIRQAAKR